MSAMTFIQKVEVESGGQALLEFSAIPSDYDDLLILLSARTTKLAVDDDLFILINGSSANIATSKLRASGTTVIGSQTTNWIGPLCGTNTTTGTFSSTKIYIADYADTSDHKSIMVDSVLENNSGSSFHLSFDTAEWSNNNAITSVTLDAASGQFVEHTIATLYGVTKGSDGTTTVS